MVNLQANGDAGQQRPLVLADAAVLLLGADGLIESWSPGAERLLGRAVAEVLGADVRGLLAPDDAARVPVLAQECRAHGGWRGLLSALRPDGSRLGVDVQLAPVTDDSGRAHWLVLAGEAPPAAAWTMTRAVLERIVDRSPVGMAVVDTDLRCVWSNSALEHFGGGAAQRRVGRRLGEIQPELDTEAIEAQMRRVLESGVPQLNYEHVGRPRSDPHGERAYAMSFVRLDDVNGRAIGVCYTVIDITERYRSRQRLTLLDRASEYIGRTLDVLQTAQDLADVAVPHLADFVAVDLLDTVTRGGEPPAGPLGDGDTVVLRRGGQQSVREGLPETVAGAGEPVTYHAGSPPVRALADGRSWRTERLDPLGSDWAVGAPGIRPARFRELGLHTAMVVPIRIGRMTMGVTTFFRGLHDEPFSEDDLRLAEEFVARAAVCMDNARRYTRERGAALALQRSLLPRGLPRQEAVDVATSYRPADELADAGGDWFDVIALSGARVALVVGDVTGHGLDAVVTMGRLRTAVRTLAALDLRPDELLAHLDDLVGRVSEGEEAVRRPGSDTAARGSSCLYAIYDPVGRCCTMASAGHPPPAVVAPDGTAAFADLPVGPRLGFGGLPFETVELAVDEGSVLALYTDGLLTGRAPGAGDDAGAQQLRRALETPGLSLDALCESVIGSVVVSTRPFDDVTLLLAGTRGLAADRWASFDLPADPSVVAHARETAAGQLAAWGLEHLAFTTELVVSELVTNAIRYGSAPIRVRLILEHTLICEVWDGSSTSPYLRHPRTTDEGGRGLFLISQFAHRWGTRYTTEGKIIWTEQLLERDGESGTEGLPDGAAG
ncbi:SpoIIE family protein phosphatase [Streptomyces pinistramenti]|uniref:SpoIIE family protein phosphatase n=1 Tax=Streptomyces pinistramenti TaxID=2884812 RepID=UPI001D09827A|nr:SpoIIE family protein phosphatase [Streptomyces pinistramenti]MCB5911826.1 SpoIIE family protein phosphatase [Streptomyces pinistramenti]